MKLIKIIIGCSIFSFFLSCKTSNEQKSEFSAEKKIQLLEKENLQFLKGIIVGSREGSQTLDRFWIKKNGTSYHIPIFKGTKSKEKIMNAEAYDVVKFAKANRVDSIDAYQYVNLFSDSLFSIYEKSKAYEISNDSVLGDFIFFTYAQEELIYLFPDGKINNPFWVDFFDTAKPIKENWYIKKIHN